MKTKLATLTTSALLALLLSGCQTQNLANQTADTALRHLGTANQDLQSKIKAEETYYDTIVSNTKDSFRRARNNDLNYQLTRHARSFNGDSIDAANLEGYMRSAIEGWQSREAKREEELNRALTSLNSNRKKLLFDQAKIQQLENQLTVLSKARSEKDMFKFLTEYAKAVKTEYATNKINQSP